MKPDNLEGLSADELIAKINEMKVQIGHLEDRHEKDTIASKLVYSGPIASAIANEIETPIKHIILNLDFIENNIEDASPLASYMMQIREEIHNIRQIIRDLQNLSQPKPEDLEEFPLNDLVGSTPIQAILSRMMKKGHGVAVSRTRDSVHIRAERTRITEVLMNLIVNAEEAMKEESGRLAISLDVIEKKGAHFAQIVIEDTGPGIPPENISRIFEPFFTTKGKKSTGLGLVVAYSVIHNIGGSIGIKSDVGKGTAFKIIVPAIIRHDALNRA